MNDAFYATAPKGMVTLLEQELAHLGIEGRRATPTGVHFRGGLAAAYRVILWSRLASRVLLPLRKVSASSPEVLTREVKAFPWEDHFSAESTVAVEFTGVDEVFRHTHYGALTVKDGIVDRFRERTGRRPSVERQRPDIQVRVRLGGRQASLDLDLSGETLSNRGVRVAPVSAPLRENLAAAMLILAGWRDAPAGSTLFDPCCGSGTLLIEGGWMAMDRAPALGREYFGFRAWSGHDAALWASLLEEAQQRAEVGRQRLGPLLGWDVDPTALEAARRNIERAGLGEDVILARRDLCRPGVFSWRGRGLLVANPPYGERLEGQSSLLPLYQGLGRLMAAAPEGWQGVFITDDPLLGDALGATQQTLGSLFNGPLECSVRRLGHRPHPETPEALDPGAADFRNRLLKNLRRLRRWVERDGVTCYRVYDADLPDFALAMDRYGDWLHVQEYQPPASIDPEKARRRLLAAVAVATDILQIPPEHVALKTRRRTRRGEQYGRMNDAKRELVVREAGLSFHVNLWDYLDTGLFLDHRPLRALVREQAAGRRFLNLFCYTASVTVYAAAGGAVSSVSVDLSNTYLEWGRRNLELNGFKDSRQHRLEKADCLAWLGRCRETFDLMFIDPPTFSNSHSTRSDFDVQRDHPTLINAAAARLAPGGVMIFSNNFRRFQLNEAALDPRLHVAAPPGMTLPPDFSRREDIHHVFWLTWKGGKGDGT
ncbi:MAG: bifunctional 23S rRNA (guanine(2069)-N(7))-methyltransferase RlmK/23S rRNA (guanine(2445)-N(2))-methyltransferase RlmL [Magnetococcus sp. WYHC-3]